MSDIFNYKMIRSFAVCPENSYNNTQKKRIFHFALLICKDTRDPVVEIFPELILKATVLYLRVFIQNMSLSALVVQNYLTEIENSSNSVLNFFFLLLQL